MAERSGRDSLADRFFDAVRATVERLSSNPGLGSPRRFTHPTLVAIRVAQVRRFRDYLIYYAPTDAGIEIIRVLHARRDAAGLFADGL